MRCSSLPNANILTLWFCLLWCTTDKMATLFQTSLPAVQTDIGCGYKVPTGYFLDQVLPRLRPGVDVDKVLKKMLRAGKKSGRPISKSGRWWGFPQDPAEADRCDETSFDHFLDMVNSIAKYGASKGVKSPLQLMHNRKQSVRTFSRKDTDLPDAYFVPRGTSQATVDWKDVSIVGEYRKEDDYSSTHDVSHRLAWGFYR